MAGGGGGERAMRVSAAKGRAVGRRPHAGRSDLGIVAGLQLRDIAGPTAERGRLKRLQPLTGAVPRMLRSRAISYPEALKCIVCRANVARPSNSVNRAVRVRLSGAEGERKIGANFDGSSRRFSRIHFFDGSDTACPIRCRPINQKQDQRWPDLRQIAGLSTRPLPMMWL